MSQYTWKADTQSFAADVAVSLKAYLVDTTNPNSALADLATYVEGEVATWRTDDPSTNPPDLGEGMFPVVTVWCGEAETDFAGPGSYGGRFSVVLRVHEVNNDGIVGMRRARNIAFCIASMVQQTMDDDSESDWACWYAEGRGEPPHASVSLTEYDRTDPNSNRVTYEVRITFFHTDP